MQKAAIRGKLALDYAGNEALNTICSNLSFSGKNIRKIVVTSCEPNDGKSFVSIQVAYNMAKRGKRVLLIDADLRLSVLNAHYDIQLGGPGYGLAHFLSGQCALEDAVYETNLENFFLIPSGTDVQAPLSLIATPDFDKMIQSGNRQKLRRERDRSGIREDTPAGSAGGEEPDGTDRDANSRVYSEQGDDGPPEHEEILQLRREIRIQQVRTVREVRV